MFLFHLRQLKRMTKMNKIITIIILCGIALSFCSCNPFEAPTGIWVCEELNIVLDFSFEGQNSHNPDIAIGTIEKDGEKIDIACRLGPGGLAIIMYKGKDNIPENRLLDGYFAYRSKTKMEFVNRKIDGKSYTFIKQSE